MEEINKSITFINKKFEEMDDNRKKKERQITELKNDVKTLNEKLETMGRSQIVMNNILEGAALLSMLWKKMGKKKLTNLLKKS